MADVMGSVAFDGPDGAGLSTSSHSFGPSVHSFSPFIGSFDHIYAFVNSFVRFTFSFALLDLSERRLHVLLVHTCA